MKREKWTKVESNEEQRLKRQEEWHRLVVRIGIRTCLSFMAGEKEKNERVEAMYNKRFKEEGGWENVLPGVGSIVSPNGIVLRREEDNEDSIAVWTFEDVNAYFGKFPNWNPLDIKKEGK